MKAIARLTKTERAEYTEKLRTHLRPGDTIYTVLRHRSASGMSRAIDLYTLSCKPDGRLVKSWLSYWTAAALGETFSERYEAVSVGGAGMDMGFHLVSNLASHLWTDGFDCTGDNCPSNDHSNNWRGPRGANVHHKSGNYALRHEWI